MIPQSGKKNVHAEQKESLRWFHTLCKMKTCITFLLLLQNSQQVISDFDHTVPVINWFCILNNIFFKNAYLVWFHMNTLSVNKHLQSECASHV